MDGGKTFGGDANGRVWGTKGDTTDNKSAQKQVWLIKKYERNKKNMR